MPALLLQPKIGKSKTLRLKLLKNHFVNKISRKLLRFREIS